jgi:uncharacterized membrane protein
MRLILFIIALFCVHGATAQTELRYDSSRTASRSFNPATLKAWSADKDFQYNRKMEPPKSIWTRFWDWVWGKIGEILSTEKGATAFKTVLILLSVLVLCFFIYRLTGMNKAGLFKRNTGDVSGYSITDEDIHSINFDQAIEQAIQNNNFRLAVRLLYLQSLKRLTDKNLINWQINKTNIAYVQELQDSSYQPFFSNLTLQFESNWYGDIPIDETEFNAVREQFNQFNRQLV